MSDAATDTGSAADTPFGKATPGVKSSAANDDLSGALKETQDGRKLVQSMALGLPKELAASREREKADIAALGPIPQLTAEEMKQYTGKPPQPAPNFLILNQKKRYCIRPR